MDHKESVDQQYSDDIVFHKAVLFDSDGVFYISENAVFKNKDEKEKVYSYVKHMNNPSSRLYLEDSEEETEDMWDCIRDFVDQNPYPDFNTMENDLSKNLPVWAEYSKANHNSCKQIYENLWDEELVKECGQKINSRGGKQGMWACYEVLNKYSPFKLSRNLDIMSASRIINLYWDGIGYWRA